MAARDVVTLNETASRLEVAQAGDTYNLPRNTNVAGNVTATGATVNGDLSVTGSQTLGGVARNTWPAPGSATVGIDDVLINGDVTARRQTVGGIDFASISALLPAITIVAHDYDEGNEGGWIDRCTDKSWYNETVYEGTQYLAATYANDAAALSANPAIVANDIYYNGTSFVLYSTGTIIYRASQRKFPMKRLVTAETGRVIIWDVTSGSPEMWMVFKPSANSGFPQFAFTAAYPLAAITINGHILSAGSANTGGYHEINWASDRMYYVNASGRITYIDDIANSDAGSGLAGSIASQGIINNTVNDVAITYLDDAPVVNGVRVPTIAVATDGGTSVIKDDGNVWDVTHGGFGSANTEFLPNGWLNDTLIINGETQTYPVPTADTLTNPPAGGFKINWTNTIPAHLSPTGSQILAGEDYTGSNLGVSVHKKNFATFAGSLMAYITSAYNTGYMVGDIQTCIVGGTAAATDRSVKSLTIPAFTAGTFTANGSRFWFKDTANIVATLGATVANGQIEWWELVAGVPHHYIANVDGLGATLTTGYVDGVAGTPSTNVTVSGGTTLTILANVDVDTVRASVTAKTAEQVARTFTDEHPTFTGSACLLTNSSTVTELTYHERQDIYGVVNGTKKDYFKGLQIVDSVTTATGVTDSGNPLPVIDLVKSGTANTYVAPAVDVNAELNDAHQALATAKQGTVTQAITSDASSVLTCPQGFKPIRVTSAAGTYISLSTNAPVFDGFLWSITSGVAASTVYDVEMRRV